MPKTSERLPILDMGGTAPPVYADTLAIEQHGAMSHLISCHTQKEYIGADRTVAAVGCRVIVPTAMLAQMAHQLVRGPEMDTASCDVPELAMQH
jgi:hypothetical protein